MSKPIVVTVCVALTAMVATAAIPVAAAPAMGLDVGSGSLRGGIELVDARGYYHCHNMPRRTRCHGKTRLPVNWPPNTNTPSRNSLKEKSANTRGPCTNARSGASCQR